MLDFSGESKKNKRFFIFFVKKEPFLSAPKGMGFPGLKFIMKILAVRTGELPEVIDIEHSLDAESEFVGGYIQTISLSSTAILVCNDDGKVIGLKPNRVIPGDFIAGFFYCWI